MSNKVLIVGEQYRKLAIEICNSMGLAYGIYENESADMGDVRVSFHMLESYYPEYDRVIFVHGSGEDRVSSILEIRECRKVPFNCYYNTPHLRHMDTSGISPDVEMGEGCLIGANVCIQAGSKIGNGAVIEGESFIGANCVIGEGCTIGSNCLIEDGCRIDSFSKIGSGSGIHEQCVIGSRVMVGSHCDVGERCCLKSGYYLGDEKSLPAGFSR